MRRRDVAFFVTRMVARASVASLAARAAGAAGAACALWPGLAQTAEAPVELQDYIRLSKTLPVDLPTGRKIEVVEFFWYECPHCNAFEPALEAWASRLPDDVELRRVPVGFTPRQEVTQRLFYALQLLGRLQGEGTLHAKVYDAIHKRWNPPETERQWADFAARHGIDRARFLEVFRSDAVSSLLRKANTWADDAEVEGVPTLVVQGRYSTSPSRAGSRERALSVADYLIGLARGG